MKTDQPTILNILMLVLCSVLLIRRQTSGEAYQFASFEVQQQAAIGAGEATEKSFILESGGPPSVHAGTLTQLDNQTCLAAWFGGSREGADDVQIFLSRLKNGESEWSTPVVIASRAQTTSELSRYTSKVGNPIIFADSRGRVWLFYVTVSFGGWSGGSVSVRFSDDEGVTWSNATRLVTSPFLNVSTLVKGKPVECEGGQILLPVYHEFVRKFGEALLLDHNGRLISKTRTTVIQGAIQPWIVPLDSQSSRAFYRQSGSTRRFVLSNLLPNIFSMDCAPLEITGIPNNNSSIAVVRRPNGEFLMACNPIDSGRHRISLATSRDGLVWKIVREIEQTAVPDEFSYPYLIRGKDGRYHLIYTWNRSRMRYMAFDDNWLEAAP